MPVFPESPLMLTRHTGWWELRLNRDVRRNALDRATRSALVEALAEATAQSVRVLVLTGTGTAFCAGLDLKERAADIAAGGIDTAGPEAIALNLALRGFAGVTIAAVNGAALGGGLTLVNACDLALAASDAVFSCPEIRTGGYASMAGPTSQMRLPPKRAAWLLLAGEPLSAATAEAWGLVNQVLPPAELLPRARELAERLAGYDPAALFETKASLARFPTDADAWRGALEYGQAVAAAIRSRRAAA
jgi:enoyl-CoA hydratase/carnithine racemase